VKSPVWRVRLIEEKRREKRREGKKRKNEDEDWEEVGVKIRSEGTDRQYECKVWTHYRMVV